jgi:hypothetical protein
MLFLCCLSLTYGRTEGKIEVTWNAETESADSIIQRVIAASPSYAQIVEEYKANIYVRTNLNVKHVNHLIKVVPSMFRFEKGVNDYLVEAYGELHYTAPDIYDVKHKALVGTFKQNKNGGEILGITEFFRINPYSTSLLPDRLVSPLSADGMKRYYYLLDSIWETTRGVKYKLLIVPRFKSNQLMNGYMVVSQGTWTIDELYATGRIDQMNFRTKVVMGAELNDRFLPRSMVVDLNFGFIGNKLGAHYEATFDYEQIVFKQDFRHQKSRKDTYDLSDSYSFSTDSTHVVSDTAYMAKIRPYPLTAFQQQLYVQSQLRADTLRKVKKSAGHQFWGQIGDAMISNYTIHLSDLGSIKCSPIINPMMIGYSKNNGYSYMQKFKFNYVFNNQQILRIVPRVGYNISRGEFYWRTDVSYLYWPQKRGEFTMRAGNGNRIYSSKVQEEVKALPDSLQDKIPSNIDYFRDRHLFLDHKIELVNGLTLTTGLVFHHRTAVNPARVSDLPLKLLSDESFANKYVSFAPRIRVEWTPGLYYYMDGKHKKNLYSKYPTFSADWERGMKGVMHSTGSYERMELDMQQTLPLGAMRSLFYRVGCGAYTDQGDMYFVDYANFSRNSLPTGWNDEIGGSFQLLDHYWYNSSDKYIRGHVTYESPFLLARHLMNNPGIVPNPRLYAGLLYVPHLLPYIEVGYGVGTHIFDFGFFASSVRGRFDTVGCKFTFELFRD